MRQIESYIRALQNEQRKYEVAVANGTGVSSYEDYRYRIGVIYGLVKAQQVIETVFKDEEL